MINAQGDLFSQTTFSTSITMNDGSPGKELDVINTISDHVVKKLASIPKRISQKFI